MTRFRRLVVGVDLVEGRVSEGARLAASQARWLAARSRGHVTLWHSSREDERWAPEEATFVRVPASGSGSRGELEALRDEIRGAGVAVDLVVSDAVAVVGLARQVVQESADVLFVGKRAHSRHDGRRIGSVSQGLLRLCPGPVWVLKPGGEVCPSVVLAACERTDLGMQILETAASLSESFGAHLHVVHALQLPPSVQLEGDAAAVEFEQQGRADFRAEVAARLEAAGYAGAHAVHVGVTSPTRAVLEGAADLCAGLVVMGTVSRSGLPGLVLGNTAERLLGTLDCSMLVLKPDDFRTREEIRKPASAGSS